VCILTITPTKRNFKLFWLTFLLVTALFIIIVSRTVCIQENGTETKKLICLSTLFNKYTRCRLPNVKTKWKAAKVSALTRAFVLCIYVAGRWCLLLSYSTKLNIIYSSDKADRKFESNTFGQNQPNSPMKIIENTWNFTIVSLLPSKLYENEKTKHQFLWKKLESFFGGKIIFWYHHITQIWATVHQAVLVVIGICALLDSHFGYRCVIFSLVCLPSRIHSLDRSSMFYISNAIYFALVFPNSLKYLGLKSFRRRFYSLIFNHVDIYYYNIIMTVLTCWRYGIISCKTGVQINNYLEILDKKILIIRNLSHLTSY